MNTTELPVAGMTPSLVPIQHTGVPTYDIYCISVLRTMPLEVKIDFSGVHLYRSDDRLGVAMSLSTKSDASGVSSGHEKYSPFRI